MKHGLVYSALGASAMWLLLSSVFAVGQVAVTTYHNDNYRSGANTKEAILTPSNVNEVQFGKLHTLPVTGYVYAQPLYVPNVNINGVLHNVLYIVTEHDQVYAFDAKTGKLLWQKNFLIPTNPTKTILPISSDDTNCTVTGNEIGITSTPVIDLTSNEIYIVAATKEIVNNVTTFYNRMHVLDIRTGVEKLLGPYFTFSPLEQIQRSALTLTNGLIFVAWASYCDNPPFHGWVMAFNKNTLLPSGVFMPTPNGIDGGIWMSGSGTAVDSSNNIYLATGNGFFDVYVGGSDYGDSILRLSWTGNQPVVTDYFTPWDQAMLNSYDNDVASGGILLLPDQPGAPYPHLLVQCGKEGTIDLVNRDNMGHFHAGSDTQIVQTLPYIITNFWGSPAMWENNLYFGGQNSALKAFSYNPETQQIQAGFTSQTPEGFTYPGPTPSVSSNGANDGIVWIFGSDSIVHAYDANNLATELYNSNQNPGRDKAGIPVQFVLPTVADGMVFVGAENEVDVYGLLN